MAQHAVSNVSEEDYQIIETNDLGSPFAVFKFKPIYISFLYFCVFLFVICFLIFVGATLIYRTGPNWQGDETDYLTLALGGVMMVGSLFGVIAALCIMLPEARTRRIIVCEKGFLEWKETRRGRKYTLLYWQEIRRILRLHGCYLINQRGRDESFTLEILYQDVKQLIALIKQRSPYHW